VKTCLCGILGSFYLLFLEKWRWCDNIRIASGFRNKKPPKRPWNPGVCIFEADRCTSLSTQTQARETADKTTALHNQMHHHLFSRVS
jgi:hypothetical protein